MKHSDLVRVIKRYSRQIKKHIDAIPGYFNPDDIHDFRVEYKKMRALLRMIDQAAGGNKSLRMPDSWKELYMAGGEVRDLQLMIPRIRQQTGLPNYLFFLEKQLFYFKEKLVQAADHWQYREGKKQIINALPSKINAGSIDRFILTNLAAIRLLKLDLREDESIHSIRKHVKDIFYIVKTFPGSAGSVNPLPDEKKLHRMSDMLGDYNDQSMMLRRLNDTLPATLPEEEQQLVKEMMKEWVQEKEKRKAEITSLLIAWKP